MQYTLFPIKGDCLTPREKCFNILSANVPFVQENRLPCPESPASTIKSLKSEKSLLLNLPEEGDKYKVFNVSGTLFVIDTSIFRNYPDTLLGKGVVLGSIT